MTIELIEPSGERIDMEPLGFAALVEHYLNAGVPFTCVVDHKPGIPGLAPPLVSFTIQPEERAGLGIRMNVMVGRDASNLTAEMVVPATAASGG